MRILSIIFSLILFAAVPQQANAGTLGCLLGAAAGGFGGSQLGSGTGQLAAVGAGTLLGCGFGSSIQNSDQQRYQPQPTYQQQYRYQPQYQPRYQSQPVYRLQPVYQQRPQVVWQQPQQRVVRSNRYCREFQAEVTIAGRLQPGYGKACRQPDGSWKIVSWR